MKYTHVYNIYVRIFILFEIMEYNFRSATVHLTVELHSIVGLDFSFISFSFKSKRRLVAECVSYVKMFSCHCQMSKLMKLD